MADPLDVLAAELAARVKEHLRDVVETPLAVSIPVAAKAVHKREQIVRDAVASGELPSWDGAILLSDLEAWFKRHRDAQAVGRPRKLVA